MCLANKVRVCVAHFLTTITIAQWVTVMSVYKQLSMTELPGSQCVGTLHYIVYGTSQWTCVLAVHIQAQSRSTHLEATANLDFNSSIISFQQLTSVNRTVRLVS